MKPSRLTIEQYVDFLPPESPEIYGMELLPLPDSAAIAAARAKLQAGAAWQQLAACGSPENLAHFAPRGNADRARRICRQCPVLPECYLEEIVRPEADQYGFRAGLKQQDRKQIIREAKASARAQVQQANALAEELSC